MRKLGTEEIAHIGEKVMLGRVRNLGGGQHEKYPTQQSSSPYTRFLPFCRLRTHHPQHLSLSLFTDCLCICICLCLCPFRFLSIKKITIKKEKERKKCLFAVLGFEWFKYTFASCICFDDLLMFTPSLFHIPNEGFCFKRYMCSFLWPWHSFLSRLGFQTQNPCRIKIKNIK